MIVPLSSKTSFISLISFVCISSFGCHQKPKPSEPRSSVHEDPEPPRLLEEDKEESRCPSAGQGRILSSVLSGYLARGPGRFLRGIEIVRHPPSGRGPFEGWRVLSIRDRCLSALKTDDVILSINGRRIRRPTDLWSLWIELKRAKNLVCVLRREGRLFTLKYEVVD